ncbi:type I polyketide synthase [Streptomyces sp. NPDC002793]|uniref:type I polyketide synthase n=1 Tax=Streptomyces sp. NPDC002793 TaxID=3154432 RepID=UPI00331E0903
MADDEKLVQYLKKVTTDLKRTRERLREIESAGTEPIAIVGMACRFPGGIDSPEEFWRVLSAGEDIVGAFPDDRGWDPGRLGADVHREGGFLADPGGFDAPFFGISPREALAMDPQQRLLLEVTWEALERAGIDPAILRGTDAGVFVGLADQKYGPRDTAAEQEVLGHLLTGTTSSVASGRIAYTLGTEGPALSLDTACSSSLVALHLAIRALRAGECSTAFVGGAAVMADLSLYAEFEQQGGLASDARCKSFAAAADGTGWGEGVAMLVVRKLSDARAAGDPVLAVVRGSAVNSDGASNGLTAPNGPSQQRVIRHALRDARLSSGQVDVVEAHGTGTSLGDPVEAQALLAAYGQGREHPLLLGSVKSNIGHTQAAAGLAGVIKMVLAMRHGVVPKTLHVDEPTTRVDWTAGAVDLLTEAREWPATGRPMRAGVSAFGISGTNAHVVLEQAPAIETAAPAPRPPVSAWLLSARDSGALREQAARLHRFAADHPEADLASVLATRRARLGHRAVVVGRDGDALLAGLSALSRGETAAGTVLGRTHQAGGLAFLFSGQGSQRVGMGSELCAVFPVFAEAHDEVCRHFAPLLPRPLTEALGSADLIHRTEYAQPALFAVEVALYRQLAAWGITPDHLIGHSFGELTAAHVAGVLSLPDACKLVAARGALMQELPAGGAMAALETGEDDLPALLAEAGVDAELAAVNAPRSIVVTGDADAVDRLVAACGERDVRARRLDTSHAFHSARLEPMLDRFRVVAASLTYHAPSLPIISNVTGEPVPAEVLGTADHWVRQARSTVRFRAGVEHLAAHGVTAFLEVGPGGLTPMARACLDGTHEVAPTMVKQGREPETLLTALAQLHVTGFAVPWEKITADPAAPYLDLPTYPFQREHYWLSAGRLPGSEQVVTEEVVTGPRRPGHPLAAMAPAELDHHLLTRVRSAAATALGHRSADAVPPDERFGDLGFDSMLAIRLRDLLATETELDLPATLMFDHPTPQAVADFLREELVGGREDVPVARRATGDDPIAIVGMACRYPGGVSTADALWTLVRTGTDGITAFPADRAWDTSALAPHVRREGGFLHDAAEFDAEFFGISPREAANMDPAQRLLLETSWEALETAGLDASALRGSRTGVFAGVAGSDYGQVLAGLTEAEGHVMTGTAASVFSGRVSYALGLEGPSLTVDTACSSSLVALHLAVRALQAGECDLALAGGSTVMSTMGSFTEFARQDGLADDGRCKAFADTADGTGWGEGVGVLVVERLSDARRHGRRVLATVAGSAVNSDGASSGLTAPNGPSQQRVIRAALADAGLRPTDVDFVEAHGTGTALGDPIEAQALIATYGREREEPLWVGSLKSNIGHTMAAAGVGGVIKTVLALRHGVLPRTLHVTEPNRRVDWSAGTVRLLTEERAWPDTGRPRRAAVSSFGMSGTNAHVIVEAGDAPVEYADEPAAGPLPVVVSARTPQALRAQAAALAGHLETHPGLGLARAGAALLDSRAAFAHRAIVVAEDRADAVAGLRAIAADAHADRVVTGTARVLGRGPVWVFPGQGSQWQGMAAELLAQSPDFARCFAECDRALAPHLSWSVLDVARGAEAPGSPEHPDVVQPLLFSFVVSLAALWRSYGVEPSAVVGHSQGEIAAACVAGALSIEDAARITVLRARALRALSGRGGMVSLVAPLPEVRQRIERWADIEVAVMNGPSSVGVTGRLPVLRELVAEAERDGVTARWIGIDYASHSTQIESVHAELTAALSEITPRPADVPFFSTVTADWVDGTALDAEYWYRNVREPVRFADAITALVGQDHHAFVEVSAHPMLGGAIAATAEAAGTDAVVVGSTRRGDGGLRRMLTSLAQLYAAGTPVDFGPAFGETGPGHVDLPTYAFQRRRHWPETRPAPVGDAAHEQFWAAVERQDVEALTGTLGLPDDTALGQVLPALSGWHRGGPAAANHLYRIGWTARTDLGAPSGTWLILTSGEVEGVTGGFPNASEARIDLTEGDRIGEQVRSAFDGVPGLTGVLCLWGLDERPHPAHPGVPLGLAAISVVLRELADSGHRARLWCATRGAVAVPGCDDAPTAPGQAAVWGLGRVAALEHPRTWGGLVDLPATVDKDAARLLAAVVSGTSGEDQVAVRANGVFGRRLHRATFAAASGWQPEQATVLVTGGTGSLGAHVTRWLAREGARKVVLLSRSGGTTPEVRALAEEAAALGTEVVTAACDVTDAVAVTTVLRDVQAGGEPITAVVHTAGAGVRGQVTETGTEDLRIALAAKVTGIAHVESALPAAQLDLVVYFSSISAVWGAGDHGAYSAANAVLDARALRRTADGVPTLSVAWGPWAGSAMVTRENRDALRRNGVPALEPRPAIAALEAAIARGPGAVVAADVDWAGFTPVFTGRRPSPLLAELPEARTAQPAPAPAGRLAGLTGRERDRKLREIVHRAVAAVLGHVDIAAVAPDRAFSELGLDSLAAVDLRGRLAADVGTRLPATLAYDHPTVEALTAFLAGTVAEEPVAAPGPREEDDPVVLVAMSCRFPGGIGSPEQLWQAVEAGEDRTGPWPADRGWPLERLRDPDSPSGSYVGSGGFLDDIAGFDAEFFGISPREAVAMDPQQRVLLESTWEAMERARLDPASLRGSRTGVYVGLTDQGYGERLRAEGSGAEGYLVTGAAASVAAGRIAYLFGLEGPTLTVDTACSSALVALHLATKALRAGECDLALVGGVMAMSDPTAFVAFSRQRALAEDGRCKSFADAADGFALAEGVGTLVAERLSDARRHGHPVLAVVAGTAVNSDGASNGLTAPSGPAQQRVIRAALADAGLSTKDVDAVEAHGTGTTLGDPIEAQAILATYGQDRTTPVRLGSVKSNLGHTQAAAGMAGVIKMALAMRHGVLPRTLNVDRPSEHVDWTAGAVRLLTEAEPWPVTDHPRRAGVSAFGISGTNAHVILEEAPADPVAELVPSALPAVLPVSARSREALHAALDRLRERLGDQTVSPLDAGYSLAVTRAAFDHRAVVVGTALDTPVRGVASNGSAPAFLFTGQGAQRAGMGRGLHAAFPVFARAFDEVCAAFGPLAGRSLQDVVFAEDTTLLDRTEYTQPALFAFEVALVELLASWGIGPARLAGHSIGELAAAYCAGLWSLPDACSVVAARGRLMQALDEPGAMAAVEAPEADVLAALAGAGNVSTAAVNGPTAVVVSGATDAVERVAEGFERRGVRVKRLTVSHAFHSPLMDPMLQEYERELGKITFAEPVLPLVSGVTGQPLGAEVRTPEYWVRQVRDAVRFADVLTTLGESGVDTFVEIGPDGVLTGLAANGPWTAVATQRRDRDEVTTLVRALGTLWAGGGEVDWPAYYAGSGARTTDLPTYAFQRRRYWLDQPTSPAAALDGTGHPLFTGAAELPDAGGAVYFGTARDSAQRRPAALLEALLWAAGAGRAEVTFTAEPDHPVHVRLTVSAAEDLRRYVVHTRPVAEPDAAWTRTAEAVVRDDTAAPEPFAWPPAGVPVEPAEIAGALDRTDGMDVLTAVRRDGGDLLAELALPEGVEPGAYTVHPDLLAGIELLARYAAAVEHGEAAVTGWAGVAVHAVGATSVRVRLAVDGRVEAVDTEGGPVLSAERLVLGTPRPRVAAGGVLHRLEWIPVRAGVNRPEWSYLEERGEDTPPLAVVRMPSTPGASAQEASANALALVRSLLARPGTTFAVLTHDAVSLPGRPADPVRAAARGIVLAAQAEHPDRFLLIDTDTDADPAQELLTAALGAEERQVALRGPDVLVPRLTPAPAPAEGELPRHGTVLLTGATGALGGQVARHLATHHRVGHLALLSRRGHDAPEAAGLLADLAATGTGVTLVAGDAADREAVAALLAAVPAEHPLTAVVHAAGVLDDASVAELTPERLGPVLRAKADAARVLHELTAAHDVTKFVLFSSAVGVLGGVGQANYTAANAFLDALAHQRAAAGLPATALAWGLWGVDGGMSGGLRDTDLRRMARAGVMPLSASDGLALLDRALAADDPALVPIRLDHGVLTAHAAAGRLDPVYSGLVRARSRRAAAAPQRPQWSEMPAEQRERELLHLVRTRVAAVLDHDAPSAVDATLAFRDIGFDSLTAVELRNTLADAIGAPLSAGAVFDHPTPAALAAHLDDVVRRAAAPARLPVLAQLDLLEAALAELPAGDAVRAQVQGRVRGLVTAWDGTAPGPSVVPTAENDVSTRLAGASEDDVLAFIRSEFGRS